MPMNGMVKFEVENRLANLLEIVETRTGNTENVTWWGPVIGADEPVQDDAFPPAISDLVSDDKRVPMTVCEEG
jgi:hypothetical protein